MLRIVLLRALLLLIPFALYALWIIVVRKRKAHHGESWIDAPWAWLIGSGLGLMIASFMLLRFLPDGDRVYDPPEPAERVRALPTGPAE